VQRYELGDKFFEIDWSGDTSFRVKYGKIGQSPTEAEKKHGSRAEAEKAWAKQVAEREKKGYALAAGSAPAPPTSAKKKSAKLASNPALERAIDDDPDDVAALQVYADWLHEQGDPRGELVSLSLAKGAKAKRAYEAHLEAHAAVLLGAHPELLEVPFTVTWKHGFIRELDFDMASFEADDNTDSAQLFRSIVSLPTMRFLTKLTIGDAAIRGVDENDYGPHWKSLAAAGLTALREIVVDYEAIENTSLANATAGDFSRVWAACPRLERVELQGGSLKLGAIVAPELKTLWIASAGLGRAAVKSVAAATLPKLEKLELWLGRSEYGGDSVVADLDPILDGARLPALRELGLCNALTSDAIAARLPKARIVKQLRRIDLQLGTMRSEGAQALVAGAAALKHLEKLELDGNLIEKADVQALKKALGKVVVAGSQRQFYDWMLDDDGTCRYTAIGE
jgi:uncharacterized protein (TIGR02996 family)